MTDLFQQTNGSLNHLWLICFNKQMDLLIIQQVQVLFCLRDCDDGVVMQRPLGSVHEFSTTQKLKSMAQMPTSFCHNNFHCLQLAKWGVSKFYWKKWCGCMHVCVTWGEVPLGRSWFEQRCQWHSDHTRKGASETVLTHVKVPVRQFSKCWGLPHQWHPVLMLPATTKGPQNAS